MAKPTTTTGAKLLIQIGDGATPEVFTAPCGLNTKGINFGKETNDITVPDCSDPEAPAWVERIATSFSAGVSGSGLLAQEALDTWQAFFLDGDGKNCRIKIDGAGWGYWAGNFICTAFNVTGEDGNKIQVEIELQSNGAVAWTDN